MVDGMGDPKSKTECFNEDIEKLYNAMHNLLKTAGMCTDTYKMDALKKRQKAIRAHEKMKDSFYKYIGTLSDIFDLQITFDEFYNGE